MTDKLHCSFCSAELETEILYDNVEYGRCNNQDCPSFLYGNMPNQVWQALIDGKAAQDKVIIAHTTIESLQGWLTKYQDALKRAKEIYVRDVAYEQERNLEQADVRELESFFDKEIASINKTGE